MGCRISTEYPELLLSQEEKDKLVNKQALENAYHKFVDNNLILHQGLLDKRKVSETKPLTTLPDVLNISMTVLT